MNYSKVMDQVLILFFIMIIGFYARKKNIIDDTVNKGLINLLLNITLPLMIIISFNYSFSVDMLKKALTIFLYTGIILISLTLISRMLFKKYPEKEKSVLRFVTIFSNCGFMGYPVVQSVYGRAGIFYTAIYNMVFNIFVWTIGVMLFTNKKDFKTLKKELFNPGIISVFIGLIIFFFSIKIPAVLYKTFDMVGGTTTPLSMIVIGAMLADIKFKEMFSGLSLYYITAIRLIIIPLAVLFILKLVGLSGIELGVLVLISGMPAAANSAIMAEMYGGDCNFASRCIFISTLLSTLTIPLIIVLMNMLI